MPAGLRSAAQLARRCEMSPAEALMARPEKAGWRDQARNLHVFFTLRPSEGTERRSRRELLSPLPAPGSRAYRSRAAVNEAGIPSEEECSRGDEHEVS